MKFIPTAVAAILMTAMSTKAAFGADADAPANSKLMFSIDAVVSNKNEVPTVRRLESSRRRRALAATESEGTESGARGRTSHVRGGAARRQLQEEAPQRHQRNRQLKGSGGKGGSKKGNNVPFIVSTSIFTDDTIDELDTFTVLNGEVIAFSQAEVSLTSDLLTERTAVFSSICSLQTCDGLLSATVEGEYDDECYTLVAAFAAGPGSSSGYQVSCPLATQDASIGVRSCDLNTGGTCSVTTFDESAPWNILFSVPANGLAEIQIECCD